MEKPNDTFDYDSKQVHTSKKQNNLRRSRLFSQMIIHKSLDDPWQ
ncbi:hypothetical protein CUZ96_0469 [Enterococcus lactis]|nr:hypothetical protein [Enterococcus lactis]